MKTCFFIACAFFLFAIPAKGELVVPLDWNAHKQADFITISKVIGDPVIDRTDRKISVKCKVVNKIKGELNGEFLLEIPIDYLNLLQINSTLEKGKIFWGFLSKKANMQPMNITYPLIDLPKYFEVKNIDDPSQVFSYQINMALVDKDTDIAKKAIDIYEHILIDIPPVAILKKLASGNDAFIKKYSLEKLLLLKDPDTVKQIETAILNGEKDLGISPDAMAYPSIEKPLFSIKACNLLAASQDDNLRRVGVTLLRNNCDLSSLNVLLDALNTTDNNTLFNADMALINLTKARTPEAYNSDFIKKQPEIITFWKNWEKSKGDKFRADNEHKNTETRESPLDTTIEVISVGLD